MHNEEENIRKRLGNKKPQDGFKTPDNYFDTFSSKVKEGIEAETTKPKGFEWASFLRPIYSIPVAAVILLATGYFVLFNSTQPIEVQTAVTETTSTDDISTEDIVEYLAQNVDLVGVNSEAEQDFMLLALTNDEIVEEETTTIIEPLPDKKDSTINLTDKEIEDFLLNDINDDLFEIL